jgi:hypothetical protein
MDCYKLIIKTIVYVAIFSILKIIIPKLLFDRKTNEIENIGIEYNKKRASLVCFFANVVFLIVSLIGFSFPSNVEGHDRIIVTIIIGVFLAIGLAISIMFSAWKITITKNKIVYRNYWGKNICISSDEINSYEMTHDNGVRLYLNNQKTYKFDFMYAHDILFWLSDNCSEIKRNNNVENIIRPAKYQRILSIIGLVVFAGTLVLGVVTKEIIVIVGFLLFTIFAILNLLYHYVFKIQIHEDSLCINSILKKYKINFSDVISAKIIENDNVSYLLLYGKDSQKPSLKLNLYYENAYLLQKIAYKKGWVKL